MFKTSSLNPSTLLVWPFAANVALILPFNSSLSVSVNSLSIKLKWFLGIFCKLGFLEDNLPVKVPQLQKVVCNSFFTRKGSKYVDLNFSKALYCRTYPAIGSFICTNAA